MLLNPVGGRIPLIPLVLLLFSLVWFSCIPPLTFSQESADRENGAQYSTERVLPGGGAREGEELEGAAIIQVEKQLFLPSEYYVGDRVELRLTVSGSNGNYRLPSTFPESSWITIHEIHIMPERERTDIVMEFTSFTPGTRTLPPLDFGGGHLKDVKIYTSSILEDTSAPFAEPRGQVLLPGTLTGLILFGFTLFFGPVILLFMASRGRQWLHLLRTLRRARQPQRLFYRSLKNLEEQMATLTGREFFFMMDELIRAYLSASVSTDFSSATGKEYRQLCRIHFRKSVYLEPLTEMSRLSELIKFGGYRAPYRKKEEYLSLGRSLVEELERSRREERKSAGRQSAGRAVVRRNGR